MKSEQFLELAVLLLLMSMPTVAAENASKTYAPTGSTLQGVAWTLDSYLGKEKNTESMLPYTQITALFVSGHVSGNGGCNNYGGTYVVSGNKIIVSGVTSNLMLCGENISNQESQYLTNLQNAASYDISNNLLRMMDSNGTLILTYSILQPLPLVQTN